MRDFYSSPTIFGIEFLIPKVIKYCPRQQETIITKLLYLVSSKMAKSLNLLFPNTLSETKKSNPPRTSRKEDFFRYLSPSKSRIGLIAVQLKKTRQTGIRQTINSSSFLSLSEIEVDKLREQMERRIIHMKSAMYFLCNSLIQSFSLHSDKNAKLYKICPTKKAPAPAENIESPQCSKMRSPSAPKSKPKMVSLTSQCLTSGNSKIIAIIKGTIFTQISQSSPIYLYIVQAPANMKYSK